MIKLINIGLNVRFVNYLVKNVFKMFIKKYFFCI